MMLRIAQLAPIAAPVTPHSGGSIERLVWLLTEELVRRGHDVTLFATGDSETSAALRAVYPHGYEDDSDLWNWRFHETMHVASAFERAREFDIIHSHDSEVALPFTRLVDTPVIHTYHVTPNDDIARAYARYPEVNIAAISHHQRLAFQGNRYVAVVHHGIDTDAFPFNPLRGDYLLFLGRIIPRKGAIEAIELAQRVGIRLVMAGPGGDYFSEEIEPLIGGPLIEYVGPVDADRRGSLLAGAAALLFPIVAPEPFGLVMIEAMACGTPVAALDWGAVPEIVENGVTGCYAHDLESLAALIPATLELDRTRVRQAAVERFDYRRMVDDYVALYDQIVGRRLARSA
jgi:glycosyltransferase involved in cell wall biosynthesis